MPKCDFNKIALQLYWNRTSAWMFPCILATYFQSTFSFEHLWTTAFVNVYEIHLFILCFMLFYVLSANPIKWSNTLKQFVGNLPANCLSVFDHFVKLALKGLKISSQFQLMRKIMKIKLYLTLSWRSPISYRNQSIDLRSKYIGPRHERVNKSISCLRNHGKATVDY